MAQLCTFIRMVFEDMTTKKELFACCLLKDIHGIKIFQAFMNFANKTKLPLVKLIYIIIGGPPAMVGSSNWFIAFRKQNNSYPTFVHYHCFNHQQALCGKVINKKEMMNISTKIVCSVCARSLQRRLFRAHLEEAEVEHIDLLLLTDVRWLSRGRFLERFRELFPEIKELLKQFKDAEYAQLEDEQLLLHLAFLTDLTALINEQNLELQRKEKNVVDMISSVNPFKRKL